MCAWYHILEPLQRDHWVPTYQECILYFHYIIILSSYHYYYIRTGTGVITIPCLCGLTSTFSWQWSFSNPDKAEGKTIFTMTDELRDFASTDLIKCRDSINFLPCNEKTSIIWASPSSIRLIRSTALLLSAPSHKQSTRIISPSLDNKNVRFFF